MKHSFALFAATAALFFAAGCGQNALHEYEVRTDVPNKAFYKDIFMDTGIKMMEYRTLPVVDYLGLQYEYFYAPEDTPENQTLQNSVFCGSPEDLNGVLLYPDGEPRFRIFYVNGGYAGAHSLSLMADGRNHVRTFVREGGSYIGSCAGAFMASYGSNNWKRAQPGYFGIWPGLVESTGYTVFPAYDIPEDSPVLKYYDFGGNNCLESIMHMNGPYFTAWNSVEGTEVLAINHLEGYSFDGYPSVLAYKPDEFSGRIIPSAGHPEQVTEGEGRDLMAALVRYAFEGLGTAKAKAVLANGKPRIMDKSTSDRDPLFTKIGDRQCHHFVFALPEGARDITVRLEALQPCNLSLRLAEGTFAFKEDAQYAVEDTQAVKELHFDSLPAGLWYVAVQNEETVECAFGEHGYEYSGRTELLNGVPYSICASWKPKFRRTPAVRLAAPALSGTALLASGCDFSEYIKHFSNPSAKASDSDSTITKIVFRTGDSSTEGVRVDDIRSSIPVYARFEEGGIVTITTSAKEICTGPDASWMFAKLLKLSQVENLAALNTSGTKYFNDMFNSCASLEKIDISTFDMSHAETTVNMFQDCKCGS